MSHVMDAIVHRRSIRSYLDKPVSKEMIDQIIKAGFYAPSALECCSWHFVVVDDRKVINQLMEVHPYLQMAAEAPCLIVLCNDSEENPRYWIDDSAAAAQNMLLAAYDLGLGSCWCAVHKTPERRTAFQQILNLPEHLIPFAAIVIGYPNESFDPPERVDQNRIYHNHYGQH